MIVGFSKYTGTSSGNRSGSSSRALNYFLDSKRKGRENNPPELVKGEPLETIELTNSLSFEHKYTSGVLSFAPEDGSISKEIENDIISRFEQLAFSGLENDQYDITWVRHTHAGHHELHFITPRVEINTGKSFNIKPPGNKTQQQFDDFRSEINAKYGLADPDDPNRKRDLKQPNHISKSLKPHNFPVNNKKDIRVYLHSYLEQKALQGEIRDRETLFSAIANLGFTISRAGKDYITVKNTENNYKFRMKGGIYEESFKSDRTLGRTYQARTRDYSKPDQNAFSEFKKRVDRHIEERSRFNQAKYPRGNSDRNHCDTKAPKLDELDLSGSRNRINLNTLDVSKYFSIQRNTPKDDSERQTRQPNASHSDETLRRREAALYTNRRISENRTQLSSNTRILDDDGIRKNALRSVQRLRAKIPRTSNSELHPDSAMQRMFDTNEILGKIIQRTKQIIQQRTLSKNLTESRSLNLASKFTRSF